LPVIMRPRNFESDNKSLCYVLVLLATVGKSHVPK
jgi:hypothetical protein